MTDDARAPETPPVKAIDPTVPHQARVWNYWVGGKDNYRADREMADQVTQTFPGIVDVARQSRAFLMRAVRFLTVEVGIRQFLDVGTGLPTADNTHEVAQSLAPASRIVYVDNDPLVLTHARALLTSSPEGVTEYIDADVRDPDRILAGAAKTLDFDRPLALMLLGVLGNVPDYEEARSIIRRLVTALPPGSHVVVNDGTTTSAERVRATEEYNEKAASPYTNRSPEQIASFLDGLHVLDPGVVSTPHWRPDPQRIGGPPAEVSAYCGVARKR